MTDESFHGFDQPVTPIAGQCFIFWFQHLR